MNNADAMNTSLFDQAEELLGTGYIRPVPTLDAVKNAIYAVITKNQREFFVNEIAVGNLKYLARNYEHVKKVRLMRHPGLISNRS